MARYSLGKLVNILVGWVKELNPTIAKLSGRNITPHSFRLIIHNLYNLGLIPFQELSFFPTTNTCEFYVTLSRRGKGSSMGRLEMLNQIAQEIIVSTSDDDGKT